MLRLLIATIIGYFVGKERKKHSKSGGSRTMAVICISACLVAIISQELASTNTDILRFMAGTVQGISFIGMGLIIKHNGEVEGLTTASSLFATVLLGFLIGLGMYWYAIVSTSLILFLLEMKYIDFKGEHHG